MTKSTRSRDAQGRPPQAPENAGLPFPAVEAARAAVEKVRKAALAPFPALGEAPNDIAATVKGALTWGHNLHKEASDAETLFAFEQIVGNPPGCLWTPAHVLGPLPIRFESVHRPWGFGGFALTPPSPSEDGKRLPLARDRWPEIKDSLLGAYLVQRARALQLAGWIEEAIAALWDALLPRVECVRVGARVRVALAGVTREVDLPGKRVQVPPRPRHRRGGRSRPQGRAQPDRPGPRTRGEFPSCGETPDQKRDQLRRLQATRRDAGPLPSAPPPKEKKKEVAHPAEASFRESVLAKGNAPVTEARDEDSPFVAFCSRGSPIR